MITPDDIRRIFRETEPDASAESPNDRGWSILQDCDLELVARPRTEDPTAQGVDYQWRGPKGWVLRGRSENAEAFLARVVLPAIHRGVSLSRRTRDALH